MLVLTRHSDQKVIINGNIVVTVVSVDGGSVRLGFEAPPDVPIHRAEIQDRINNNVPIAPPRPRRESRRGR